MVTWTGTIYCVQREVFHLYLLVLVLDFLYAAYFSLVRGGRRGGGGDGMRRYEMQLDVFLPRV